MAPSSCKVLYLLLSSLFNLILAGNICVCLYVHVAHTLFHIVSFAFVFLCLCANLSAWCLSSLSCPGHLEITEHQQ